MKKILIIGATSGIGNSICHSLVEEYYLILTGRNEKALEELSSSLGKDNCESHVLDLTDMEGSQSFVDELDKVDGVVFCAGVSEHTPAKFIKRKHLENTFEVNLFSPILLTSALLKSNRINKSGSLVYLSSASTRYPYFGGSLYVASKSALEGYVKTLAIELGSKGIRANSICPVFVRTKMLESVESIVEEETMKEYVKKHPFGVITTEDVVGMVSFLLSEKSNTISGQSLMIGNLD